MATLRESARRLVEKVADATAASRNEDTLRHRIEMALEQEARILDIPWYPLQLDEALSVPIGAPRRFVDVAHGSVVVEYESPRSFGGREGAHFRHATAQAEEYAKLILAEEGRSPEDYSLLVWDGAHVAFGRFDEEAAHWERLAPFNVDAATRLLRLLKDGSQPLVYPRLIAEVAGPDSSFGRKLIPRFYRAISQAMRAHKRTSKTMLLFTEWRRLFGQVAGIHSDRLRDLLTHQGNLHHSNYADDPAAYLFALNTYIALVAKIVAAKAMPQTVEDIGDSTVEIAERISRLEDGSLFASGGVTNMVAGDFFSWYADDLHWSQFADEIDSLIQRLAGINFDVSRKSPESTRDLFKGIYQSFVPSALRHALGEYYTPDWLASHALDQIQWRGTDSLMDPTCGSGTFLLEALRRRLQQADSWSMTANDLLRGLYGMDLNPLAVLAARASLVVSLGPRLRASDPVTLPVYLADAINPAEEIDDVFEHMLQTERGTVKFRIPAALVRSPRFFDMFARLRELITASLTLSSVYDGLVAEYPEVAALPPAGQDALRGSIDSLIVLHSSGWDGIWCSILADRFKAAAIGVVSHIAGNPPWVKWSHLPPEYANVIKPRCLELGVFSQDRWVGGIESDISTVVTYEVVDKWLAPSGLLAFFITGTVFANESSQGFRRFEIRHRQLLMRVLLVEDFAAIAPFEGVANFPTLLIVRRDQGTRYPVPYRVWTDTASRNYADGAEFRARSTAVDLLAAPVPGTDAGPWIKGTAEEHEVWAEIFGPVNDGYVARKGITTDRNGIFFVKVRQGDPTSALQDIENDPDVGRTKGVAKVRGRVETEHLFPLLRGRGVSAFSATPDPDYHILLPQRGMHGDPTLPTSAPGAYRFFSRFEPELRRRSSYKRFQARQPYWSVWSTGAYTFAPYKIVWQEMTGRRFVAAYIGMVDDLKVGRKLVVPDHKLYFVPVETEAEAAFICGILNAPVVARAISAYAAQLSLGVSVIDYLKIPRYSARVKEHREIANLAMRLTNDARRPSEAEAAKLDELSLHLLRAAVS